MIKSILTILCFTSIFSSDETIDTTHWDKVIDAIIQVESRGNPNAYNKSSDATGAMQIKKIVVDDCNEYLKKLNKKRRFTYEDRWDVQKSKEMFVLIQMRYNKTNDIEKAARIWNGGCCYTKESTDSYYRNFLKFYNKEG
jgi:hypothetical protein